MSPGRPVDRRPVGRRSALVLVLLALVLPACGGSEAACDRLAGVQPGTCLVEEDERIAAPAFPDDLDPVGDADPPTLDELRGDVVVINYWGSWCAPCRTEQPELNRVADTFADRGVSFVGVNVRDTQAGAVGHEDEFATPYASWFDPSVDHVATYRANVPRSTPATVLVDRSGRVAATINGETGVAELTTLLDILTSESAPS